MSFLCLLLLQGECNCIAGHWLEKRHLPITSLITARAECYGNCLFAGHLPSSITGFLEQAQAFLDACHPSGGVQPHGISIRSQCSVVTTLFSPLSSFAIRSEIGFVAQAPSCGRMKAVLSSAQALARWEGCQWAALPVTPAGWARQWLWGAEGVTVPRRATRHTQGSARGFHIKEGEKGVKVFC